MRRELAAFRLEPDALHQPLVFGLHIKQGSRRRNACDHRARLAAAERGKPLQMQLKWHTFDAAKHGPDFMGDIVVDVADKPQRQMVVFRVDPARARQAAPQGGKALSDIGRDFYSGEETRHDETFIHDPRAARALAINSSTRGRIRATIASTPAVFGCRPSPWFNLGSAATPSRKNG